MGTSEIIEWNIDSIMKRDIRVSDSIMALLTRWNDNYLHNSIIVTEEMPTEEDLARIEEFKKKGWI
jgi:hypothetical protein